jgi:xanthosine utilization system XapX-like protein
MSNLLNMNTAIAAGILFAAIKFSPNASVKAAALGVAGVMVARQIPYLSDALSA